MRPMLAAKIDLDATWPGTVYASPKIDGIRALVIGGVVVSRSLKPIPSSLVQVRFGRPEYEGLDGELVVGSPTEPMVFNTTTRVVMSESGIGDVRFLVFDTVREQDLRYAYRDRLRILHEMDKDWKRGLRLVPEIVPQTLIDTRESLLDYEERTVDEGYEGIMLRRPSALYKFGRSTVREGALLKVKRFEDGEAEILGAVELEINNNPQTLNALGYSERTSHQENLIRGGVLGSFRVMCLKTGVVFSIGTGFTATMREQYWQERDALIGRIIRFKSFAVGVKDKPRFPTFDGFRNDAF